jgi:hypothetical protein
VKGDSSRPIEPKDVAFHEAGHAVAAILLGKRFNGLTIIPKGINAGSLLIENSECYLDDGSVREDIPRDAAEIQCMIMFAGPLAGAISAGKLETLDDGRGGDNEEILELLGLVYGADEITGAINVVFKRTLELVVTNWTTVEETASQLLQHQSLAFQEAVRIVEASRALKPVDLG